MIDKKKNLSLALSLVCVVAGMILLVCASVPLYRIFCQATGFGGVAQATTKLSHPVSDRHITVRFDANVSPGLDWAFAPMQREITVKVGEEKRIEYSASNRGNKASTGTATFNITPVKAGQYFDKMQCFCFSKQTIAPHEQKGLGVTFFIDPAINDDHDLDDIRTITLSYTFFPVQK